MNAVQNHTLPGFHVTYYFEDGAEATVTMHMKMEDVFTSVDKSCRAYNQQIGTGLAVKSFRIVPIEPFP